MHVDPLTTLVAMALAAGAIAWLLAVLNGVR